MMTVIIIIIIYVDNDDESTDAFSRTLSTLPTSIITSIDSSLKFLRLTTYNLTIQRKEVESVARTFFDNT